MEKVNEDLLFLFFVFRFFGNPTWDSFGDPKRKPEWPCHYIVAREAAWIVLWKSGGNEANQKNQTKGKEKQIFFHFLLFYSKNDFLF